MNNEYLIITRLLSAAIRGEPPVLKGFYKIPWDQVFSEAKSHKVHTLIYPALKELDRTIAPTEDIADMWESTSLFSSNKAMNYLDDIQNLLEEFNNYRILTIVLKGLYLKSLYIFPELRTMGDYDLLINGENYEAAEEILLRMGYTVKHVGKAVVSYVKPYSQNIELHISLFDEDIIKDVICFNNAVWNDPIPVKIGSADALTLSIDHTIIYLMLHMAKHMKNYGSGLRQLADLTLFIEKHGDKINWKYFWDAINKFGLRKFSMTAIEACEKFLDLRDSKKYLYNKSGICEEDITVFMNKIITSGVFGRKSEALSIGNSIGRDLYKEGKSELNLKAIIIVRFFSFLFPGYNIMSARNPYLRKFPYLLPIAWINRIVFRIVRKNSSVKNIASVITSASKENEFLKRMEL